MKTRSFLLTIAVLVALLLPVIIIGIISTKGKDTGTESADILIFYFLLVVIFLVVEMLFWFLITKYVKRAERVLMEKYIKTLPQYPIPGTIWIIVDCIDNFDTDKATQKINCFRVKAQEISLGGRKIGKPIILQVWFANKESPKKDLIYESYTEESFYFLGSTFLRPYGKDSIKKSTHL